MSFMQWLIIGAVLAIVLSGCRSFGPTRENTKVQRGTDQ